MAPTRREPILAAHRVEAPVDFTVKSDPALWAEQLGGIVLPTGTVRVEKLAGTVADLPGFAEGEWWVQDAAASLPARLFGDVAGQARRRSLRRARRQDRAAGACRRRGHRHRRLEEPPGPAWPESRAPRPCRRRLQADILDLEPEELFDAVLLDAPCSSTGTVRRHPDVPWTKSPADIEKLAGAAGEDCSRPPSRLVRPGGRIVFSNCSLDPLEGEDAATPPSWPATAGVADDPVRPARSPASTPSSPTAGRCAPRRPISILARPASPAWTASSPRDFARHRLKPVAITRLHAEFTLA